MDTAQVEPSSAPPQAPAAPRFFYGWIVLGTLALILASTTGARFAFSAFLKPVAEEFGWDRASLSLAISFHMIVAGLLQPFTGAVIDRVGSRLAGAVGTLLLGVALIGLAYSTTLLGFYVWYGLVAALAVAICSTSLSAKLIGLWFNRRRAIAHSLATSGIAVGQLIVLPLATWLMVQASWQAASQAIGLVVLIGLTPIAWLLIRNTPQSMGLHPDGDGAAVVATSSTSTDGLGLGEALRTAAYWKLAAGLLVCGITMSFPSSHFIPFASDLGMHEMTASQALGLAGGLSLPGALAIGYLADRFGRAYLLAVAYALRGLTYLALALTTGPAMLVVASVVLGLSWGSTVPLSAAIAADAFGQRNLGAIFGTLIMIMWIGSGIATYVAGEVFDHVHHYDPVLVANLVLGLVASAVIFTLSSTRRQLQLAR